MGFRDWVLGWTKDFGVEQTGLSEQPTHFAVEPVEVAGEFEFLAKGTSFRQDSIKSLGLGKHKFVLIPERGNKHDAMAVMVQGIKNDEPIHVGYLPMGSETQAIAFQLGTAMLAKDCIMAIDGEVLEGESGIIVQLEMPGNDKLAEMLSEYS